MTPAHEGAQAFVGTPSSRRLLRGRRRGGRALPDGFRDQRNPGTPRRWAVPARGGVGKCRSPALQRNVPDDRRRQAGSRADASLEVGAPITGDAHDLKLFDHPDACGSSHRWSAVPRVTLAHRSQSSSADVQALRRSRVRPQRGAIEGLRRQSPRLRDLVSRGTRGHHRGGCGTLRLGSWCPASRRRGPTSLGGAARQLLSRDSNSSHRGGLAPVITTLRLHVTTGDSVMAPEATLAAIALVQVSQATPAGGLARQLCAVAFHDFLPSLPATITSRRREPGAEHHSPRRLVAADDALIPTTRTTPDQAYRRETE